MTREPIITDPRVNPLIYYAAHRAALFPIPRGQKNPYSPARIVNSWKKEWSTDPAQWEAWSYANPGCGFGIVAYASNLIIVDVDTSGGPEGEAEAQKLWAELCRSWGLPGPLAPHVRSARGGWHIYVTVPEGTDASQLRQPDAVKERINIRCVGFTVTAGSYFGDLPYTLLSDAPPHPAPPALIEHCQRAKTARASAPKAGTFKLDDIRKMYAWMAANGMFDAYEDWLHAGMAAKAEYGDTGLDLWELAHDGTVETDVEANKWDSFSDQPNEHSIMMPTLMKRAYGAGYKGGISKTTESMFGDVAAIAIAAGATLSGMPVPPPPPRGMPMMAGQEELTRLAAPILVEFLAATADAPTRPAATEIPTLPATMAEHGLYALLNDAIARVVALAEPPNKFKPNRVTAPMAVLSVAHQDVFESVRRRIEAMGRTFNDHKIKLAAKSLEDQVQRAFVRQDDWIYDSRSGLPESDNPDNVVVFLGIIAAEVRWNAWLNRAEIQGFEWPAWVAVDDVVIAKLKMRALRTGTRFRVGNEFLKETLLALAHVNQHDPVVDRINSLVWDGTSRLVNWLTVTCGVPADAYHAAVGANVIGGMVKRARTPGAKHDEVMILIGKEGTMKSALCRVLALQDDWFTDSVAFDGSPQNIVPQLFGRLVVELAELDGMAKKEVQHIKAFITRQSDNITLKYKAFASDYARRCVFIGTSNEISPLISMSGNRRFLPVRVASDINLAWLKTHVEQLVAEAAHLEAAGADFSIPRDIWATAAEHQEAARSVSDVEARLCDWFAETPHTTTAFVTTPDLADLCDLSGWKNVHSMRNLILTKLGFREVVPYINGNKTRGWLRGPAMLPKHIEHVTRYMVGKTPDGRPRVTIRTSAITMPAAKAALPPLPGPPRPPY